MEKILNNVLNAGIKCVVFDFDGVITKRGEALKDDAFGRMFVQLSSKGDSGALLAENIRLSVQKFIH